VSLRARDFVFFGLLAGAVALVAAGILADERAASTYRFPVGSDLGSGIRLDSVTVFPLGPGRFLVSLHYLNRPGDAAGRSLSMVFHNEPSDPRNLPRDDRARGFQWLDFRPDPQPDAWGGEFRHDAELAFPSSWDRRAELRFAVWDHGTGSAAGPTARLELDFGQLDLSKTGAYSGNLEGNGRAGLWFTVWFVGTLGLLLYLATRRDRRVVAEEWSYAIRV